jgi:hypothetical protein
MNLEIESYEGELRELRQQRKDLIEECIAVAVRHTPDHETACHITQAIHERFGVNK